MRNEKRWTRWKLLEHRKTATRTSTKPTYSLTSVMKQSLQTVCNFRAHDTPKKPQSPARPCSAQCTRLECAGRRKCTKRSLDLALGSAPLQPQNRADLTDAGLLRAPIKTPLKSWSIMLDFAGITPSAILVKKWRGKPLFMALRPDLPENPLSAQIYLEIE